MQYYDEKEDKCLNRDMNIAAMLELTKDPKIVNLIFNDVTPINLLTDVKSTIL